MKHDYRKRESVRVLFRQLKRPSLLVLFALAVTSANAQLPQYGVLIGAVSQSTDALDIFISDANGFIRHGSWRPGGNWQTWLPVGAAHSFAPHGAVTAISRSPGHIDLYTVGTDGQVWTAGRGPGYDWWGWVPIGNLPVQVPPGSYVGGVSRSTDHLDIFVVGSDGQVWTAAWEPDFGWYHGWWPIPNIGISAKPGTSIAAVSHATDCLDIYVVDVNGNVWEANWDPNDVFRPGQWQNWNWLQGIRAVPGSPVTTARRNTGYVDLFLTDVNGRIETSAPFPRHWPYYWRQFGWAQPGAVVSSVSKSQDQLDVFVEDNHGFVYTSAWQPGTDWTSWKSVSGFPTDFLGDTAITVISRSQGHIDLFFVQGYELADTKNNAFIYSGATEPDFNGAWHLIPIYPYIAWY
jgi:hypothetical protein